MYCRTPREEPTSSGRCVPGVGSPMAPVLLPYKRQHTRLQILFLSALATPRRPNRCPLFPLNPRCASSHHDTTAPPRRQYQRAGAAPRPDPVALRPRSRESTFAQVELVCKKRREKALESFLHLTKLIVLSVDDVADNERRNSTRFQRRRGAQYSLRRNQKDQHSCPQCRSRCPQRCRLVVLSQAALVFVREVCAHSCRLVQKTMTDTAERVMETWQGNWDILNSTGGGTAGKCETPT